MPQKFFWGNKGSKSLSEIVVKPLHLTGDLIKMPRTMAVPAQEYALFKFCVHFCEVLGFARTFSLSSTVCLVFFSSYYCMMKFQ